LGGEGHAVGPDLASVRSNGKLKLLTSLVDPNREVAPQFITYVVETKDGESHAGLIVNESSKSLTLRQAFGNQVDLSRSEIAQIQSTGVSAMPEGLEAGLSHQGMADLLEFIFSGTPSQ
jgi:putative heme-binding domain-containing protein